jgi:hypothetical protein
VRARDRGEFLCEIFTYAHLQGTLPETHIATLT